jgi:MFS family permease
VSVAGARVRTGRTPRRRLLGPRQASRRCGVAGAQTAPIIARAVFVVIACVYPGLLVGGLAGEIRADLGLSGFSIGLAAAIFWLTAAVASSPGGRLVDRLGPTTGIRLGGALAALGALGAAAASSPAMLTASLAVGGSANAFVTPGVSALASSAVPRGRQGFAFGVQLAGPAIAALLAGLALPLIAGPTGWRNSFIVAAALALVAATIAPQVSSTALRAEPGSPSPRIRPLVLLAAGAAAANAAAGALLTFLVIYCLEIGLSPASAGALLVAASGGAVAVRLGLGALADRRPDAALGWVVWLLALSAAGYALVTSATPALVALGAVVAVALGWGWPGVLLFAVVTRHRADPGAAVGVVITGFFAGAVIGPLAAGPLVEDGSYELIWWLCAGLACLAAAAFDAGRRALGADLPSSTTGPPAIARRRPALAAHPNSRCAPLG